MLKILVIFNENWADEMDVAGFSIMSKEKWESYVNGIPDKKLYLGIGSNEEIEFRNKHDYLTSFDVKELSQQEYDILHRLFPRDEFGETGMMDFDEDFDMDEE